MSDTGGRQVRPTRYRPIPDNAYDPRITDLSRPLNSGNPPLIGSGAPGAPIGAGMAPGATGTGPSGWVNRNASNITPFALVAGVSVRALPNNPRRTGLVIQNKDPTSTLQYSLGNDVGILGKNVAPGGADLYDFTTPADAVYLICAAANNQVVIIEIQRTGT